MARPASVLVTTIALAALTACGAAQPSPAALAVVRLEALAKLHADEPEFKVRLNPAPCDCPPFEVELDGAWHRTYLEPKDPSGPAEALRTDLQGEVAQGHLTAVARIAGKLSKSVRQAATLAPCLVLKVLRTCPATGCTPAP